MILSCNQGPATGVLGHGGDGDGRKCFETLRRGFDRRDCPGLWTGEGDFTLEFWTGPPSVSYPHPLWLSQCPWRRKGADRSEASVDIVELIYVDCIRWQSGAWRHAVEEMQASKVVHSHKLGETMSESGMVGDGSSRPVPHATFPLKVRSGTFGVADLAAVIVSCFVEESTEIHNDETKAQLGLTHSAEQSLYQCNHV